VDEHKAEADTGELFQASTSCYTLDNTAVQMRTPLKYTTSTAYYNHRQSHGKFILCCQTARDLLASTATFSTRRPI